MATGFAWRMGPTVAGAAALAVLALSSGAQTPAVQIDDDDIGGVVRGPRGPEAGVWVIAETRDLGTRFTRSVVTDDQGRYVVPDLPRANYTLWARGYGLVDSAKETAAPGRIVNLTAALAPNEAAAARYYPAIYWYSMLKIPPESEFGGKGDVGRPHSLADRDWQGLEADGRAFQLRPDPLAK